VPTRSSHPMAPPPVHQPNHVKAGPAPVADGCCGAIQIFDGATPAYRRVLAWVIAINIVAFAVVLVGGVVQGSASVTASAMDFLGDGVTYGISLWAIGHSVQVRSNAALFKSATLILVAVATLGWATWRTLVGVAPEGLAISGFGLFGVIANLMAALLLVRYRQGDANVRSVWLCTRNDMLECLGVAVAGGLVWITESRWPDLIVGGFLAVIFLQSAYSISAQALRERRAHSLATPAATGPCSAGDCCD
jgi:Co/Zn/Cd efflux system component